MGGVGILAFPRCQKGGRGDFHSVQGRPVIASLQVRLSLRGYTRQVRWDTMPAPILRVIYRVIGSSDIVRMEFIPSERAGRKGGEP